MMESRILPFVPERPLRVHWPLATCGIAVAIGGFCGLLKGLSLANSSGSVDGPISSRVLRLLNRPTELVTPGEVIVCYALTGAAVGLALVSMPLATFMALRFRRELYAARERTRQRLNQEMAVIVERTRRGPADRA